MVLDLFFQLLFPFSPEPPEFHEALSFFPGFRTPPIASEICSQRERSFRSCFLPAAVSRYTFTSCLFSEVFQSAPTHFCFSRRCSAGYKEPASTCSRSPELARIVRLMPKPCCGPQRRVCKIRRSSVPCRSSIRLRYRSFIPPPAISGYRLPISYPIDALLPLWFPIFLPAFEDPCKWLHASIRSSRCGMNNVPKSFLPI